MPEPVTSLAGRRVLVVEDEFFIADDMQRALREHGAEVLGPVPTVEQALDLIAATARIDAAVLDINLRDVMIFPVADRLSERGVPFVFSTGYEKTAIPARYASVPHCEKPVEAAEVARALFD